MVRKGARPRKGTKQLVEVTQNCQIHEKGGLDSLDRRWLGHEPASLCKFALEAWPPQYRSSGYLHIEMRATRILVVF